MAAPPVKIIFGAGGMGNYPRPQNEAFLQILEKYNINELDTAYVYVGSEKALGELEAPKKFTIHTKAPAFQPGAMRKESVLQGMEQELAWLGVGSVETYFLHAPDEATPIEETLDAINILHKAGKFKHFGLSNYSPASVEQIHDICTKKNYPLPTVYQGNYNPVARHIEKTLFPLLRRLNIAFYAYSPLAGGFLVKDAALFSDPSSGKGRWSTTQLLGVMYHNLYGKPTLIAALKEWASIAADAGISKAALAYRWVVFHSALSGEHGDGCIVGASRTAQLDETLRDLRQGKLSDETVRRVEAVWESVREEAPLDNYHSFVKAKV